jgi:hypothetical protein
LAIRDELDVKEGLRCLLLGDPEEIPQSKKELYSAYFQPSSDEKVKGTRQFGVERIVDEFNTVKQVLINNAIPVDIAEIKSAGQEHVAKNSRGWGTRVLFDKKVFLQLL